MKTEKIITDNIKTINNITDVNKFKNLKDLYVKNDGFVGRPIALIKFSDDNYEGLTGSHRILAARELNIEIKALIVEVEENEFCYHEENEKYEDKQKEISAFIEISETPCEDERLALARDMFAKSYITEEFLNLLETEIEMNM